jgi:putative DNA primase/helicase
VFLSALRRVFGGYATTLGFTAFEYGSRRPVDMGRLRGPRLALAAGGNRGRRLDEALLMALSGDRTLVAPAGSGAPSGVTAKLWLSLNRKPRLHDESDAFWERLRLVPFGATFGERAGEEGAVRPADTGLAGKLATEAQGILAWCVRGALEWQRHGLPSPEAAKEALAACRRECDHLGDFVAEACELCAGISVSADRLYAAYRRWWKRRGAADQQALSMTAFGRRMAERFEKTRDRWGVRYVGVTA